MRNPIIKIFFIGIILVTFSAGQITFADQSASVAIRVTVVSPQPSERMYIYLNGQRVASKDNSGKKYFYHNDHLGGTSVITDESGQEVKRVDYWPYGLVKEQSGAKPERHLFTGKEFDAETGLYFYGARYYDPNLCRFISADPIGQNLLNPQSLNRYSYCLDNPAGYTDPSGNDAKHVLKTIGIISDIVDLVQHPSPKTVVKIIIGQIPGVGEFMMMGDAIGNVMELRGISGETKSLYNQAAEAFHAAGGLYQRYYDKMMQLIINKLIKEPLLAGKDVITKAWNILAPESEIPSQGEDNNSPQENRGASATSSSQTSPSSNTQIPSAAPTVRGGAYIVNTPPGTIYNLMEHNLQSGWGSIQNEYQSGLTWTSYDKQAFSRGYLGITRPVQGPSGGWQSQTSYFGHAIHSGLDQWTADSVPR